MLTEALASIPLRFLQHQMQLQPVYALQGHCSISMLSVNIQPRMCIFRFGCNPGPIQYTAVWFCGTWIKGCAKQDIVGMSQAQGLLTCTCASRVQTAQPGPIHKLTTHPVNADLHNRE